MNDLYTLTNVALVPYFQAMQYIQLIEQVLIGRQPIRYTRHQNKCYIDVDWAKLPTGVYIALECYQVIDPAVYPDVWKDRWLIKYCTALVKRQWGNNLKVYSGLKLPGGITLNGQKIYDEAEEEIEKMEKEMILNYSLPVSDMIG